jgi:hypothetical protein
MLRVLTLTAALVAFASTASAAETKVNLDGKTAAEAHALIATAAVKVCREAYAGDPLSYYLLDSCAQATTATTLAKISAPVALNTASVVVAAR